MIAITGANGLLGSFIIEKLVQENLPVIAIARRKLTSSNSLINWREADVTDPVTLSEALQGATCVIHTAAMVSFAPGASKKIFAVNVEGTKNVINACFSLNIPKLIHISSIGSLGKPKGVRLIDEESKWIPGSFNTDYAESKYLAELEVFRAAEEGLSASIVNPSVILTPGDWNRSSARLFKFVWDEKPFYTEGQFNYVDIRDLTDLIYKLYNEDHSGQKFIANSGSISFYDFFQKVASRFGKKGPSIKVNSTLINIAAAVESLRSRLSGAEPLFVSKTLKANRQDFLYDNKKAINQLKIKFRSIDETLDWCCKTLLANITTNK